MRCGHDIAIAAASRDQEPGISVSAVGPDENPGGVVTAARVDPDRALQLADAELVRDELARLAGRLGLRVDQRRSGRAGLLGADGLPVRTWRERYPYDRKISRKEYEFAKRALQIELLKLQRWVKSSGARVLLIFEGRDAAGKGGTIRRFTENLNPRGVRVVALEKPTAHERGDGYLLRYTAHLPAPGEIVFFDRSWYNRAGVERVMDFCSPDEYARFLRDVPGFEREIISGGVTLVKFWLSVTRAEQLRRFVDRYADPVKRWKLSPIDLASLDKWDEYTAAREIMFAHTDLADAPWTVIMSNDKKRARLAAMRHVLCRCDYTGKDHAVVGAPDPSIAGRAVTMRELPDRTAPGFTPLPIAASGERRGLAPPRRTRAGAASAGRAAAAIDAAALALQTEAAGLG